MPDEPGALKERRCWHFWRYKSFGKMCWNCWGLWARENRITVGKFEDFDPDPQPLTFCAGDHVILHGRCHHGRHVCDGPCPLCTTETGENE